jgi:hypothetical protein
MIVVQIEKPANVTLDVWFTELRSWLDSNQCEPDLFYRLERIKTIYNVTFDNDNHARLFAFAFKKYAPSIRRTVGTERLDFLRERGGEDNGLIGRHPNPLQQEPFPP